MNFQWLSKLMAGWRCVVPMSTMMSDKGEYDDHIMPAPAENEEVLLGENSDGLQCADRLTKCKDAVCYLQLFDDENIRRGTGFLAEVFVQGKIYHCIATNNHVLPSKDLAIDGVARFHYEGEKPVINVELRPDLLFFTNEVLDYTLVGCDSAKTTGITPIEFSDKIGNIGDSIFIFQHPKGEPKKVSYHEISDIERPFIFYKADTDVGSSGSPVFRQFRLIAIHSKGSDRLRYNKGTLCGEILEHLNYGTYTPPKTIRDHASEMGRKRESLVTGEDKRLLTKKQKITSQCNDPSKQPTEEDLQSIAADILSEWKSLGRKLGVPNSVLMKIHKDHINFDDITEKAFAMLVAWKEKQGTLANFGFLRNVLMSSGLVDTAQKHC